MERMSTSKYLSTQFVIIAGSVIAFMTSEYWIIGKYENITPEMSHYAIFKYPILGLSIWLGMALSTIWRSK